MSDCGCKAGKAGKSGENGEKSLEREQLGGGMQNLNIVARVIIFLFAGALSMVIVIPLMIPLTLVMLWNTIVFNKSTNLTGVLTSIGKFLRTSKKRVEEPEDPEDKKDEEINPEDYVLMDVDVID